MFKFFKSAAASDSAAIAGISFTGGVGVSETTRDSSIDWNQQENTDYMGRDRKNAIAKGLLRDFPWLWAIKSDHSWDDALYTKVSQDTTDLKSLLVQQSDKTKFTIWSISTQRCAVFNIGAACFSPTEGTMWAEVITQQTFYNVDILYLVMVSPTHHITIFRHPEKKPLNELVKNICQLHGGNACWKTSSVDYLN